MIDDGGDDDDDHDGDVDKNKKSNHVDLNRS